MKKFKIVPFLLLVLLLAGCADPASEEVDLTKAYENAMETIRRQKGDTPYMEQETDAEVLEMMYPGIGDVDTKQLIVWVSPMSGMPAEVVMLEASDAANAKKAEDILKARVESQAADSFYPITIAQWKNAAKVTTSGNFVVMAVMPEGVALPPEFLAQF